MKKQNGFTLIELLAIIVILAIIAVITVPIILNIIENSKMGAAKDSAYGYKDSVNKWYVSKLTEDPNYVLNDGTYSVSELEATVEGKQPGDNSWVTISKTNVTDGCLQFDEYKVEIINGKVTTTEKGECKFTIEIPGVVDTTDGAKYYTEVQVTYYDPTQTTEAARKCEESDYNSNADKLGTTGCLRWYAYSEKGEYVNMILDHNINVRCSGNTCKWAESVNRQGPILALATLSNLTSSWNTGTPKVPNKYGTDGIESNPQIVPASANDNKYSIDYGNYKARLITKEEVERIKSVNSNAIPSELALNMPANSNGAYGYWTSSPRAGVSGDAWFVGVAGFAGNANLGSTGSVNDLHWGLRPVITIPVS